MAGLLAGLFLSLLVIHRSRTRWLLAGQHQAELCHGWHVSEVPVQTRGSQHWVLVDRARSLEHPSLPR